MPKQQTRRAKALPPSRQPSTEIQHATQMARDVFAEFVPSVTLTQFQLSNILARAFQAGWLAAHETQFADATQRKSK